MKKFFTLLFILFLFVGLVACTEEEPVEEEEETFVADLINTPDLKIAMITDVGDIDDKSFNQGTWEGIVQFAVANEKDHDYYKPTGASTAEYVQAINLAISEGANIVVTPGFLFETAVYIAQTEHPTVKFILIDGEPHTADYSTYFTASNTINVLFDEHESGFLAGYSALLEGFEEVGFFGGMAVPAVKRFGIGFVAGTYLAASALGNDEFSFPASRYEYFGDFEPSDTKKAQAAAWYAAGTEAIFVAAGGAGSSVMAAATDARNDVWVYGVDIDQSKDSNKVISSALKGLAKAVQAALRTIYLDEFVGGQTISLGAKEDAVGLPWASSRFDNFTKAQFDSAFAFLATGVFQVPATPEQLEMFIENLGY
ncbi:MAG: BMP family ABC transporter substrate-binding protein, partial [Acholeplasmataceae bacterium]|nr:BMP family ABC transporter substrate-binding protein [Acholeplasmataceae bacterium]